MLPGLEFLSTLSLRRATILCVVSVQVGGFLSTLSLRRATVQVVVVIMHALISIHALLAESDSDTKEKSQGKRISIHALLAESDSKSDTATAFPLSFLSTLSLRRATANRCTTIPNFRYFYPRSPCGERPNRCTTIPNFRYFYPRSPCGERLSTSERLFIPSHYFYPRSPCGERQ